MNRKILSVAILVLATTVSAPLAQAGDDDRDWDDRDDYRPAPVYREKYVERHYYHPARHHGWHKKKHHDYHHYRPPVEQHHYHYYQEPRRRASSAAPILLGSMIGGVVGHEIGYGDPGHTAAGAVIGTVIGYEIARHR